MRDAARPSESGTVICDLDGVVYLGESPIPGAGEALARIAEDGHQILFCTNNSSRRRAEIAARIHGISGFPAAPESIVTSSEAAVGLLDPTLEVLIVGGDGIGEALAEAGLGTTERWEEAGSVVVGLDRNLTYDRIADAASAVRGGARLVATNDDPTYPTSGRLLPGAGAVLAAIEAASGRRAKVAGKPHPPMRKVLRRRLRAGPVWVVGDRIETDIAMARAEGWTAFLVLTGVTASRQATDSEAIVVTSLADVPPLL